MREAWYGVRAPWNPNDLCRGRVLFSIDGKVEALVETDATDEHGRVTAWRWQEFVSSRLGGETGVAENRDEALQRAQEAVTRKHGDNS